MAGKPVEPEDAERASANGDADAPGLRRDGLKDAGALSGASERIGPVTIARLVKDDGRALIVYARETTGQP
jgi:hypothetical protein